ncbi:MAG: hypothetical protein AVDCRST_MAG18-1098 [uncultured Thermomicrobiales bacterium]|uniref:Uncharacterized protein n=1 Tax=uncultured Thermomicrobiales bacterium TaxID=1645740 RepID=A0A6J4UVN7_9BACT|nr:MAG: hypothetical protein AVDCRST_MAG18-1098 [uncultured Thermomicrobiales bacterium]
MIRVVVVIPTYNEAVSPPRSLTGALPLAARRKER